MKYAMVEWLKIVYLNELQTASDPQFRRMQLFADRSSSSVFHLKQNFFYHVIFRSIVMQDDNRMVELLAEMLHEIKGLREGFQRMEKEQHAATERLNSVEMEQRRTTNAIWELSQMMQKVVWEPANKMAEDISDLKHRVAQLEGAK
jgi:hypothetical protein